MSLTNLPLPVSYCIPHRTPSKRFFWFGVVAFCLLWLSYGGPTAPRQAVVVSIASSVARLDRELPVALETLLKQLTRLDELHLWLPIAEKPTIEARRFRGTLPAVLHDTSIRLHFVEDAGPGTKFIYVLKDLVSRARKGEAHLLEQPLIIADDDHAYSPHLVTTLLDAHTAMPNAMVGLRGWRVRRDWVWGVQPPFVAHHVQHGAELIQPYRVSVLTANAGYLLLPRFLFKLDSTSEAEELLFNATMLDSTAAHLADDIVMSGLLSAQSVERYVVPLNPFYATPSVDITVVHALEKHIAKDLPTAIDGWGRQEVNNAAISMFQPAWLKEDLFYDYNSPSLPKPFALVRMIRFFRALVAKATWQHVH